MTTDILWHVAGVRRRPGSLWLHSPAVRARNANVAAVVWLCLGADADAPFRPWPAMGLEWRAEGRAGGLVWFAFFGLCFCVQVLHRAALSPAVPTRHTTSPGADAGSGPDSGSEEER